ncbi:hypothetical protein Metig_1049 [Methanotorris igneus Kol 5]|uniref:Uncharacterized protein n=2 Tax=Methanotorris igneus TaxID=2189 RepID=F6BDM9_METIK|nr:hypothetical protein Metig_1049 [Methanotorris igneus Kol 5]
MNVIITIIIISFSILLSVKLYSSLMKRLKKEEIKLKNFEVIYKFVIPIIFALVGVEYSNSIFISAGINPKSFTLSILDTIVVILILMIYHVSLAIISRIIVKISP